MTIRTYYKATISLSIESMWLNPKTGNYEGLDPGTIQEAGIVDTLTADTPEKLLNKIQSAHYYRDGEPQVFEHSIEWLFEGEHSYNTPSEEQIPFFERYTARITKVTEEDFKEPKLEVLLTKMHKGEK